MDNQTFAEKHYLRGCKLFEVRRHKEAEEEFRKGLSQDPSNFHCLFALSAVLINRRAYEESEIVIQDLIHYYPNHYSGYLHQAKSLFLQGKKESLESIQTALQLEPENEECLLYLAKIENDRNHFTQAYDAIQASLQKNPEYVEGLSFKLGLLNQKPNYSKEAEETIELLLNLAPNHGFAHHAVAKYYSSIKGKVEVSLVHYYRALQLEPGNHYYKQEYTDLVTAFKMGQKGPTQMFGIETNGYDHLALVLFFLLSISSLMSFTFLTSFGDIKVNLWDLPWLIAVLLLFFFVLPFIQMFFYLKFIRKKSPYYNPFKRRIIPHLEDPFLTTSFWKFFTLNSYWNIKVILGCITTIASLVYLFTLLGKWISISEYSSFAVSGSGGISVLFLRLLKFREE